MNDNDDELKKQLGVSRVFLVDEPPLYNRLSLPFRMSWRHELATVAGVFVLGFVLGLLVR
jgi:hypothetical protein